MKIILLTFGKTSDRALAQLESGYAEKISKYNDIELIALKEPSGHTRSSFQEQMQAEARLFEQKIQSGDFLILLDERGKNLTSVEFSGWMGQRIGMSYKRLVFMIGGPYGLSPSLKKQAGLLLSLSSMTFTHEMARVILLEQIYRSFNILANTPYHHI